MVKGGYVLNLIHKYCVHHSPIVKCENMCGHMRARVRQCIHACLFVPASNMAAKGCCQFGRAWIQKPKLEQKKCAVCMVCF